VAVAGLSKIGGKTLESAIKTTTAKLVTSSASRASAAHSALAGPMNEIITKMDDIVADSTSVVPALIERVKTTAIGYAQDKATGSTIGSSATLANGLTGPELMKSGGIVYASNGAYVQLSATRDRYCSRNANSW
jgi:hypothetical protein